MAAKKQRKKRESIGAPPGPFREEASKNPEEAGRRIREAFARGGYSMSGASRALGVGLMTLFRTVADLGLERDLLRLKMAAAKAGKVPPKGPGPISEETREKLRARPHIHEPRSEETRAKISESLSGKKFSKDHRDKIAAGVRAAAVRRRAEEGKT